MSSRLSSRRAEPPLQLPVTEHAEERSGEGIRIVRRDEEPRLAVHHDLRYAADIRRHHGDPRPRRLDLRGHVGQHPLDGLELGGWEVVQGLVLANPALRRQ
jgi:hypothetical protein